MNLLTVSDKESSLLYSPNIKLHFSDVDMAISCGDLSYFYLEYIVSSLDIPMYFVRGNHAKEIEYGVAGEREAPWGAINLHKKVKRDPDSGLILAGIEGSLRYRPGKYQYSQFHMWLMVLQMVYCGINCVMDASWMFLSHMPHPGESTIRKIAHTRASKPLIG